MCLCVLCDHLGLRIFILAYLELQLWILILSVIIFFICMYLGGGEGATGRQPVGYVAPPVSTDNVCIVLCIVSFLVFMEIGNKYSYSYSSI